MLEDTTFRYTDEFLLLGFMFVYSQALDQIFKSDFPAQGLTETGFGASSGAVPTVRVKDGQVHDPKARVLGTSMQ